MFKVDYDKTYKIFSKLARNKLGRSQSMTDFAVNPEQSPHIVSRTLMMAQDFLPFKFI